MNPRSLLPWVAAALLSSCAAEPAGDPLWDELAHSELDPAQREQLAAATAARDAMVQQLMSALAGEIADSGPAAAIAVCRDRAPEIAAATGARLGVAIGRTSFKLRNPANRAPAWTEPLLENRPEEPRLAASRNGDFGVVLPIRVASQCLMCHGPQETLSAQVREALTSLYPRDRATGFAAGDLRGWFWVEVPARDGGPS